MEAAEFRRIMGHWATGVSVVTSRTPERTCGLTANAITSVSLSPTLVLVCVEHNSDTHKCITASGAFCIHVLASDQERIARRFAEWDAENKFEGIAYRSEITGSPVLDNVLSWVDCRVTAAHDAGDHTIFVGEVVAGDARDGIPLVYYRGGYGRFTP